MHPPRIALYSHDAMGIGHMRRNMLIADTLRRFPTRANVLLIAGAGELNAFQLPPGVDCLTLPALRKNPNGTYEPRGLQVPLRELLQLRAGMILTALESFRPDVMIVDKVPRGLLGELEPTLRALTSRAEPRLVLGMRDVLDEPSAVQREWGEAENEAVIRDHYQAVWVYGDPAIYDPVREYGFTPEVAAKVRYAGYLDPRCRGEGDGESTGWLRVPPGRLALCQVGGGGDGAPLARAFMEAERPEDMAGILLTGPFMPPGVRHRLEERAARDPRLWVVPFVPEPVDLLMQCERVIAMGGYNTLSEILSFEKPALIVPRVSPRREQLIRARCFRDLGLLELLTPDRLNPDALSHWLARDVRPPADARERIDFDGLSRIPQMLHEVMERPWRPRWGTANPPPSAPLTA